MRKITRLTTEQVSNLRKLAAMPDSEIDTRDIAEWTQADFRRSVPFSSLYRPRKLQITTRIDADVLKWLKSRGSRYQSRLNSILRLAMEEAVKTTSVSNRKRGAPGPARKNNS